MCWNHKTFRFIVGQEVSGPNERPADLPDQKTNCITLINLMSATAATKIDATTPEVAAWSTPSVPPRVPTEPAADDAAVQASLG
jgi:hypothetical protein